MDVLPRLGYLSCVTDGIYSPVGDHVHSRGRLTDTASDSSGVSPALATRPIPAGLSLDDVHIGGDNGHIGAAGDVGPGGNSGSPGGYIGSPGDYSGTPGGQSQYSGYGSTIPAEVKCMSTGPLPLFSVKIIIGTTVAFI